MMSRTAIRVDDDLATGQTGIGSWTAQHKRTGRIDKHAIFIMRHTIGKHIIKHRTNHMFRQLLLKPRLIDLRIMLRGHQHRVKTNGSIMLIIFNGHLGFAIGTQMRHFAILTNLSKTVSQAMSQINRQWHQHIGLVARIAEHHALIAGALRLITLLARCLRLRFATQTSHTLVNLRALLGQRNGHAA